MVVGFGPRNLQMPIKYYFSKLCLQPNTYIMWFQRAIIAMFGISYLLFLSNQALIFWGAIVEDHLAGNRSLLCNNL